MGSNTWTDLPWNEEDYNRFVTQNPTSDHDFLQMHKWILHGEKEQIDKWLQENYIRNCTFLPKTKKTQDRGRFA